MKVVIDTNIIIDHLRNVPQATKQLYLTPMHFVIK